MSEKDIQTALCVNAEPLLSHFVYHGVFPLPRTTTPGTLSKSSIRSLVLPVHCTPYQIPLPLPVFDRNTLEDHWSAKPAIHISQDTIIDILPENKYVGTEWRVVTRGIEVPPFTFIGLGTRIIFKGVDDDNVSYFVIGRRIIYGQVSHVDVHAYRRTDLALVCCSLIWPPFTLLVPTTVVDPAMGLSAATQEWMEVVNSSTPTKEAERRMTYVHPVIGFMVGIVRDIFYRAVGACMSR